MAAADKKQDDAKAKAADAKAKNADKQEVDSLGRPADDPAPEVDPGDMFTDAAEQVKQDVMNAKERADKGQTAVGTKKNAQRKDDPETEERGGLLMSDESGIAPPDAE